MTKPKLHMIANAHIDPVWLWVWQDGLEVAQTTCRNAVELLRSNPEYRFSRSSASVYQWIEQTDPELFAQISRHVAEGRWNIVNGWWVQPDCNIPCGESLVRQGLYGQLYFKAKFGRMAKVGFNVDTFGHCGALPQILARSGLGAYVFMRPGSREKELPSDLFWWQGPDGTRVLACRIPSYDSSDLEALERNVARALDRVRATGRDMMCFYGKGDHGGGPGEELVARVKEMREETDDVEIAFSTPDEFFDAVKASSAGLPIVSGDLQHHSRGCYTVVSEIKSQNRKLEIAIQNAERLCAASWLLLGTEYPRRSLRSAWEVLLFHQFHDVLGGTSIRPAYDDASRAMDMAMAQVDSLRDMAMEALSAKIRTMGQEGHPLLVFNPASVARRDPIRFQALLPEDNDLVAVDEGGVEHPIQVTRSDNLEGNRKVEGFFVARLPALGYRVFWIRRGVVPEPEFLSSGESIQNSKIRISVDPKTGFLASIYDLENEIEYLSGPSRAVVLRDESDTWSHDVVEFRDEIGEFAMDGSPEVEVGRAAASIRIRSSFDASNLIQEFRLHPGEATVECRIELDWHEPHRMLKLSFPVAAENPRSTCEIPYGVMERPTKGQEECGQRWVDVSGSSGEGLELGLTVANDCKYGYDVLDSEIRISLVRSPVYAFHRPKQIEPGKEYLYTDQGRHSMGFMLMPHLGAAYEERFTRAERLNNPPIAAFSNVHDGRFPSVGSILSSDPANVVVGALKVAEKRDELIVRLLESTGKGTKCRLQLPLSGLDLEDELGPWEVKTLVVSRAGEVSEVDMLEEPLQP